jgi:hypothetical protein
MQPQETPPDGHADVRIVAASPEAPAGSRRAVAASPPERSPAIPRTPRGGTRLQLTADTTSAAEPARSWLETSRSSGKDGRRK